MLHAGKTLNPVNINISLQAGIWYLTPCIAAFTQNCQIFADTSVAAAALLPKKSPEGKTYYCIDFDVILLFGLTELKAQISWLENVRTSLFCACVITNMLKNL